MRFLQDCLDAVLALKGEDFEVIVVDNASEDGSADLVADKFPMARLIRNRRNLGFAGGCNAGLKMARGNLLVLLNQDTRVCSDWLQALKRAAEDPKVGVAGCKILYPDGETIQHAGGWIEWPVGLAYHYGQGEQDTGAWDTPRTVEYVTGAAMAFRRDVLERVGPLDEGFWPGYFEDIDFCFRTREAGHEVWYIPEATLIHEETTSSPSQLFTSQIYQRGRLRFLLKHMPPERLLSQFVPAERDYQSLIIRGYQGRALRTAYMEAILRATVILSRRWQADQETIHRVIAALQCLYHLSCVEDWEKVQESMGVATALDASTRFVSGIPAEIASIPSLQEFVFRSRIPVVGPLIARFRSLWYGVAARWAVRCLMQQQEAVNQVLAQHLIELADGSTLLAREIASLSQQSQGSVE